MTVDEVIKYRYWIDSVGVIWERQGYCIEPTVNFIRMIPSNTTYDAKHPYLGGAVGCLNLKDLKPITCIETESHDE